MSQQSLHSPTSITHQPLHSPASTYQIRQISTPLSMHNTYNTQRPSPTTTRRQSGGSVYQYQPTEYTTTTNAQWLHTSVSNWHTLAQQLQQQCDDKSDELKQLVGKQYKTLIGTADKVNEMQILVNSIHQCIDTFNSVYYDIQAHCKHAVQPYDSTNTVQQYSILSEIDVHLHTIQDIWTNVESNNYIHAIDLYITSSTQNNVLLQRLQPSLTKIDTNEQSITTPTNEQLLPLLQRVSKTLQQVPNVIQHRATQCLRDTNVLQLHSNALTALTILNTNRHNALESVLQQYLSIQQKHITHIVWCASAVLRKVNSKHNAAAQIVSNVYQRAAQHIIATLNCVRILFSSQPTSNVDTYDEYNITQQISRFTTQHKQSSNNDISNTTISADRLTTLMKQWYATLTTSLTQSTDQHSLVKLLQYVTSISSLCRIRDTTFDTLNYIDTDTADDTAVAKQRQKDYMRLDDSVRVLFAATLSSQLNINTLFDQILYEPLLQHSIKAVDNQFKQFSIISHIDTELKSHSETLDTAIDITKFITQCKTQLQLLSNNISELTTCKYICTCQSNKDNCIYHNDQASNNQYIRFTYYERFLSDTLQPHIQRQYTAAIQSVADTLKQRLTALEFKLLDTTVHTEIDTIVKQCLLTGRICYALTEIDFVQNSNIVLNTQAINTKLVALCRTAITVWSKHIAALITKQYTTYIQNDNADSNSAAVVQPSSYVLQILFAVVQHLYNAQADSINSDIVNLLKDDVTTSLLAVFDMYDTATTQRCIDLTTVFTMLPLKQDSQGQTQLLNSLISKCKVDNIATLQDAQQYYTDMLQQLIQRHRLLFGSLLGNITAKTLLSSTSKHKATNNVESNQTQAINLLQLAPSIGRIPGISVSLYPIKAGHTSTVSAAKHRTTNSISQTRPRVTPVTNTTHSATQSAEYIANYGLGLLSKYTGTQQYSTNDASLKAQQVLDRGQILGKTLLGKFISGNTDK